MNTRDLTLLILAGNPKCFHEVLPGTTYFDRAATIPRKLPFAHVVVVTCDPTLRGDFETAPAGTSLMDSLQNGLACCRTTNVLVIATDLCSTPEAVEAFCLAIKKPRAPIYCGVASVKACREIEPGIRTHFICRYGKIRFASAYIINRNWFMAMRPYAEPIFMNRKNIGKVAKHVTRYIGAEIWRALRQFHLPRLPKLIPVSPVLAVDYDPKDAHVD